MQEASTAQECIADKSAALEAAQKAAEVCTMNSSNVAPPKSTCKAAAAC